MKIIKAPVPNYAVISLLATEVYSRQSDDRLERCELVRAFADLAVTADGVLGWGSGNHTSDVFEECDEDFEPFRDLAAAGMAFTNHSNYRYRGPFRKEDAQFQHEFAAISRVGLAFIKKNCVYPRPCVLDDRDAHISKAELYKIEPWEIVAFYDTVFWDMVDAWFRYFEEYDSEYDLWNDELAEFILMSEAIEGFRFHTFELKIGRIHLDWESMNLALTRDVPKAAVYLQFYLLKIPRRYVDGFMELREIAEAFDEYEAYPAPAYFPHFLELPAEHRHYDKFGSRCCIWEYPNVLIACDNQNPKTFPLPETARAPRSWLPELAITCKAMLGEAVEIMLRTARFDLKYIETVPRFKIATWLQKFIKALPFNDGTRAIKYLCFPHMSWYNSQPPFAVGNPSFELMVTCQNLRKIDVTFYYKTLHVWPIFGCTNLEEMYFDGIHELPSRGGSPSNLQPLEDLAKWLKKEFLVRQNQAVRVEVVRRWGKWKGRQAGSIIDLNEADMEQVAEARKFVEVRLPFADVKDEELQDLM